MKLGKPLGKELDKVFDTQLDNYLWVNIRNQIAEDLWWQFDGNLYEYLDRQNYSQLMYLIMHLIKKEIEDETR